MDNKPPLMKLTGAKFPRLEDTEPGKRNATGGSMTPERLSEIQGRYTKWPADKLPTMHDGLTAISDASSLVKYIETLHERLSR